MMQELKYSAEMAAMQFDLTLLRDNVHMQWSGFNDSLGVFVQESLKFVDSVRGRDFKEVFEQVKAKKI
jgi:secreted Zn-dependent insulinase-like peptidase